MRLGGVTCTAAQAWEAVCLLAASRSTAIRQILRARGNPLHACDYWSVIRAREAACPVPRVRGTRREHAPNAKLVFSRALEEAVAAAAHAELDSALAAFSSDERYAAAIAGDAVAVRTREHAARARSRVRAAVIGAVTRCAAAGGSTCHLTGACGTGQCPFAPEELRDCPGPAPDGRLPRPPCHAAPGQGFSDAAAAAWLAASRPWHPAVHAGDSDRGRCTDDVAA